MANIKRLLSLSCKRVLIVVRNVLLFLLCSSIAAVVLYRYMPVYFTPLMGIRLVENFVSGHEARILHEWVPMTEISTDMPRAVISSEDNNFMKHRGFDWDAIEKAKKINKQGKRTLGASTISQQTAKNVFLYPKRSWIRKGLETYFTILIEIFWSKERIMEVYLNVAEWGDGIYGVERASQIYFGHSAKSLKQPEAALLAAALPRPLSVNPRKPSNFMLRRKEKILKLMKAIGPVNLTETEK